jgi:hypothetical protein
LLRAVWRAIWSSGWRSLAAGVEGDLLDIADAIMRIPSDSARLR